MRHQQLIFQSTFYPPPGPYDNCWKNYYELTIKGRIIILKNEPVNSKIYWFELHEDDTYHHKCDHIDQVPEGHQWTQAPEHCPRWVVELLPRQVK